MRISKQSSGGRGEFELAEDAPGGPKVTDLFGCDLLLKFGAVTIPTGIYLKLQGGKRRLRLRNTSKTMHAGLMAAAVLMLPRPIREEAKLEGGLPVLRSNGYLLHHIELDRVELLKPAVFRVNPETEEDKEVEPGLFSATATLVVVGNQSFQAENVDVGERMSQIEAIWSARSLLPGDLRDLIAVHQAALTSGFTVPKDLQSTVDAIQGRLEEYAPEFGVVYSRLEDPVPALISLIGAETAVMPTLLPLDQIPPEQSEIRRREIDRWRIVKSRGASAIRFRKEVREAYDWTCIVCGLRLPPTPANLSPGVDSAHILPWATYDADEVSNGVCLCKLHHWAFDEGLIRITFHGGRYFVELGPNVEDGVRDLGFSIEGLKLVTGEIPGHRLPNIHAERPSPDYLRQLYDELD